MNEVQKTMYTGIISVRNNETNLRWTRSQLFFLINAAVISLMASAKLEVENILFGLICLIGLWLSVLWLWIIIASHSWVSYWDGVLAKLEALDGQPVTVFRGEEWEGKITQMKNNFVLILIVLTSTFVIVWAGMLGYWLYNW